MSLLKINIKNKIKKLKEENKNLIEDNLKDLEEGRKFVITKHYNRKEKTIILEIRCWTEKEIVQGWKISSMNEVLQLVEIL